MKKINAFVLLMLMIATQSVIAAETITVAVAANVKFAFDDIASAFTKETGIAINPVFGSSGKIVAQVREGAPYDVFLSADMEYPEKLFKDGQAVTVPRVYAYGKLVLWTLRDDLDLTQGLSVLTNASVRKVAIANPKLAPYGAEAIKALDRLKLKVSVEPKLIYAENIAQVAQYIDSSTVDAGFTAKSMVIAPEVAGRGKWLDVPQSAYDPIAQGAVILHYGQATHGDAARKFYGFLFSPKARAILEKFQYGLP